MLIEWALPTFSSASNGRNNSFRINFPRSLNLAQMEAADAKAALEEVRRKLTKEQVSGAL